MEKHKSFAEEISIHANRPMELFSFQSNMELKAIRIANGLFEEFLDENLVMLIK